MLKKSKHKADDRKNFLKKLYDLYEEKERENKILKAELKKKDIKRGRIKSTEKIKNDINGKFRDFRVKVVKKYQDLI